MSDEIKKEFVLEVKNSGRFLGLDLFKIIMNDEDRNNNYSVNCEILLSDMNNFPIFKGDKVKVIIEKIQS